MPLSNYARNKLMDSLLEGGVYISLHCEDPGLTGENEITGGCYKRQLADTFSQANDGEKASKNDILFEQMPESTISHIGVWDSKEKGNFIWGAELLSKKAIHEGDTLKLGAGNIILGLS